MPLQRFIARLTPRSAFATPLRGDLLFGQLVWSVLHTFGDAALNRLLDGYTQGQPFAVIGDPFPTGHLPRPTLPLHFLGLNASDPKMRKAIKNRRWIAANALSVPLSEWHQHARSEIDVAEAIGLPKDVSLWKNQIRGHNSLDRRTGTTGTDSGFAPFERELTWFHPQLNFELPILLDTERLSPQDCQQLLARIGQSGYGKEASSGAGKFEISDLTPWQPPCPSQPNSWLTLAPCAPQGDKWQPLRSFYSIHVRFGRHGDAAVKSGNPWKNPLLLAEMGALLTPQEFDPERLFVGQGLTGISRAIPTTVHQGYAPVLPTYLSEAIS